MPTLASDLVNQAFLDLGVITVNQTISAAMSADGLLRLNQLLDSLSAEGLTVPNQIEQAFPLLANTSAYTLGVGGTLTTAARPLKVTAWRAYYGNILHAGGRVLSMAEFGSVAQQRMGETTPIPSAVGADTSYPLINVRVFPPTSLTAGQLELAFWTAIAQFATLASPVTLPVGWEDLLHFNLAARLYPQYPRPSNKDIVFGMAQETKKAFLLENAMAAPQPVPAAPQGQR